LVVGKKEADQKMIRSLYQRGLGYSYDAVKIFMPAGAKAPIYAPYTEHVPPDPTSAMFWLKNRDSEHWRDVQQLEHSMGKYVISDKPMTEEQWIKERAVVIDAEAADITLETSREQLRRDLHRIALEAAQAANAWLCSLEPILEMDNLLTYIDGISDERDSVPLLLAVRRQWPKVKAVLAALKAERVRSTPVDPAPQVPFSEGRRKA
jgi:hypothetical protein